MPFVIKPSPPCPDEKAPEKEDGVAEITKGVTKLDAQDHLDRISASFNCYLNAQFNRINMKEAHFEMLPMLYTKFIPQFPKKFMTMRQCISQNEAFLKRIASHPLFPGESSTPAEFYTHNVRSVLQQCVRDWADEGDKDRKACYGPILDSIEALYQEKEARKDVHVLDPGCSLGRLVYELVRLGFTAEGSEISNLKFLCSDVITNKLSKDECTLYPWVDQVTNQWSFENQSRGINIPNIDARQLVKDNPRWKISQGDFREIFKEPKKFDVIVSCFFLDTALNVMDYLKVITYLLKPGGYLISMGPLIYGRVNTNNSASVELTYEELKSVLPGFGLEMIKEKRGLEAAYIEDRHSMLKMRYNCAHFICQKSEMELPPGLIHNPDEKKVSSGPPNVYEHELDPSARPRDHRAVF